MHMKTTAVHVLIVIAGSACASSAFAQDSVSTTNGLPGDAVSAFTAGAGANNEQTNDYVIDLSDRVSSWSRTFRFGPLLKGSSGGTSFFTSIVGAQAASNKFTQGPFLRPSYGVWDQAPGAGVNFLRNSTPGTIDTSARTGQRFAVGFMEFGAGPDNVFGNGDDEQNIISGIVNFNFFESRRLYVSRVNAAVNKANGTLGTSATASFGMGGVDEVGNTHFFADNFGLTAGTSVQDKRYIRVNAAARNRTLLNTIANTTTGDINATPTPFQTTNSAVVPTIIPTVVASRPVMIGGDFLGNYQFEQVANSMVASTAYLPANGSPRGPVSFSSGAFSSLATGGSDAGVAAVLSRAVSDTRTRGFSVWGVNNDGSIDSSTRLVLPFTSGQIVDPTDGFDPTVIFATPLNHEFTNYASQVSFRGGSGPVALAVLPGGDLLSSATVATTGNASSVPQSFDNYLAVARTNAGTGVTSWIVAAHTGNAGGAAGGLSKIIRGDFGDDGIPGTGDNGEGDGSLDTGPNASIGRLAKANEVNPASPSGPSISSPAMDRFGNLYFLANVSLKKPGPSTKLTQALIKANFDLGTNRYELELLAEVGDVIAGRNSGTPYQIQFLGINDGDSVDSGAIFSGSIVQDQFAKVAPTSIYYGSPYALGALVIRTKIVYDRNSDGQFLDPTVAGNSGSPDQAYNVAMIVMPGYIAWDFNQDAFINQEDLSGYITAYLDESLDADYNEDGALNQEDLSAYITDYLSE